MNTLREILDKEIFEQIYEYEEGVPVFKKVAALLKEYRKVLVETLVLDAGKPYDNAEGEISATIRRLNMALEEARKIFGEYVPGDWSEDTKGKVSIVLKEPVGVVLAISPFNYPVYTSIAKVVPALLAGNTVVAKPPSADPLAFLMVARLFDEAGIPPGCLNVLTAQGKVMDYFTSHECVDMITFTGSTKVGQHIAKNAGMKRLHLELGGKGCAIVLDDADLDLAVSKILRGTDTYHNCYFAPTVLDHVPLEADIAWEETFGPVATIIRVKDLNEAVEVANRSRYGLDSCIFTNGMYNGWLAAKLLENGAVTLNDAPAHGVGFFPFGGNKASGMGREGVGYSIDEMTRLKTVVFNLEPAGLGKVSKYYQI
ncbi:MAG: aldehyde dehydrogenase family protein [Halobacteriota archaeon]